MFLFVEFIKTLEYLLIEFVLDECSFDDCIGLNVLIIMDGIIDTVNFLCFNFILLFFVFL